MCSAYVKQLQKECAAEQAAQQRYRESKSSSAGAGLVDKVARWHSSLPAELRHRAYTMRELVYELHASPMAIGIALAELHWARKRSWRGNGPYIRFWQPPE